jgi:hypothetical protein
VKVADAKQEGIKAGQAAQPHKPIRRNWNEERATTNRPPKVPIHLAGELVGTVEIIYGEEATESFELSFDLLGVQARGMDRCGPQINTGKGASPTLYRRNVVFRAVLFPGRLVGGG